MPLLRRATRLAALASISLFAATACHVLDFTPQYGPGEIDIYDDLFSISVVDANTSVAVGYHGTAYYTSDGGETWKKGKTPTNKLLYSVSMADAQYGWAVGQVGTILRTEDGGKTWVEQPNLKKDEASHLFGVQAIDADRAIAVGTWGSRIYTEDGGKTWQDNSLTVGVEHPQFVWLNQTDQETVRTGGKVYEDVSLQDVFCLDDTHCWLIGEFGYVFFSEDAGRSWTRGEILGGVRMDPIELDFDQLDLDDEHIDALTEFARKIEDETHLNVLIDPIVSEQEIATYYEEENPEPLFEIISARLDETKGVLEEAGLMTDRLRMYNKPPWDYADFMEHDETFLQRYVDGRRGEKPLLKISVIQNPFLFTIRFSDENTGLISGLGGVVLRTFDGGRTWTYVETDRRQALFAVDTTNGRAIAVGEKGLVRYSNDGGETWVPPTDSQFPTIFTFMRDLYFARDQPETGFIVGQEGMVLRTRDGGETWAQVLPPPDRRNSGRLL
ncbi:MAG: WD40/YVTN/BNR-like repeat-containing protein [Myxococcota bacterium]